MQDNLIIRIETPADYAAEPPDAEVPYFLICELKPGFLTGVTDT